MAMENNKVVYSSTGDFLKYISARTKEKEKNKFTHKPSSALRDSNPNSKKRDGYLKYN